LESNLLRRFLPIPWLMGIAGCCLQVSGTGASECLAAGGSCLGASVSCSQTSAQSAIDCGGGMICCGGSLHPGTDAGASRDAGSDAGIDGGSDGGADAGRDAGPRVCGPPSDLGITATYKSIGYDTDQTVGLGIRTVASADLNGDGLLDLIAVVDFPYSGLEVFLGQSDGGLSSPVAYLDVGLSGSLEAIAIGDVDGNGSPDVVVSDVFYEENTIAVLINDGVGGLTPGASLLIDGAVQGLAIGDFNGDGRADLLVSNADIPDGGPGVQLLFGQAAGSFSAPVTVPGIQGTSWGGVAVGDLNADGISDIVGNSSDGTALVVLLNQRDGGSSVTSYPTPASPQVALLPEENGPPDLIIENAGPLIGAAGDGGVQVLRNTGQGRFILTPPQRAPGGLALVVGDFNGDCIPDVVTTYFENCAQTTWAITILYGDEDGGFSPPVGLEAPGIAPRGGAPLGEVSDPRALAVGDDCGSGLTVYGDASRR
jgi:hypothetical protein